jgi:hypothetical protein
MIVNIMLGFMLWHEVIGFVCFNPRPMVIPKYRFLLIIIAKDGHGKS